MKRKTIIRVAICLLAIRAVLLPAAAAMPGEDWAGTIEGSVTDPNGAPISAATVRLSNTMTGAGPISVAWRGIQFLDRRVGRLMRSLRMR